MIYFFLLFNLLWAEESLVAVGVVSKNKGQAQEFLYERYQDKRGETVHDRSIYKNTEGLILVEERMEIVNGKLLRYDIDQRQSSERGWIVVKNNSVIYNFINKEGNLKKIKRVLPDNFIAPLSLFSFLKKNWEKLLSGDAVNLNLGIWKRQDHYSFQMKRIRSPEDEIIIKIQISNIILRAFTSPMYFVFGKAKGQIKNYKGPLNLKEKKKNGKFRDYIGYVEYDLKKVLKF